MSSMQPHGACGGPVPLSSLLKALRSPLWWPPSLTSLEVPGDTSPLAGAEHPKTARSQGKELFRLLLRSHLVAPSASKSKPKEKRLVQRKPRSNKGFFHFWPWLSFIFAGGGLGSLAEKWRLPSGRAWGGKLPLGAEHHGASRADAQGCARLGKPGYPQGRGIHSGCQGCGQHLVLAGVSPGAPPSSPTLGGGGG